MVHITVAIAPALRSGNVARLAPLRPRTRPFCGREAHTLRPCRRQHGTRPVSAAAYTLRGRLAFGTRLEWSRAAYQHWEVRGERDANERTTAKKSPAKEVGHECY